MNTHEFLIGLEQDIAAGDFKGRYAGFFCDVRRVGICIILDLISKGAKPLFQAWPSFSGDLAFPVRGYGGLNAEEMYMGTDDKYEGPYGAARRRLLKFCVETRELWLPVHEVEFRVSSSTIPGRDWKEDQWGNWVKGNETLSYGAHFKP